MKITIALGFFNPCPPLQGGAVERMWHQLAGQFAAAGNEVNIVSRRHPNLPASEVAEGVRHVRLRGYGRRARLWENLALDLLWSGRVLAHAPFADIFVANSVMLPLFAVPGGRLGRWVVNLNRMPRGQLRAYRGLTRVQASSEAVRAAVGEQAPRLLPITRVFENPVDLSVFRPRQDAASDGIFRIGFVGRIHPEKGIDTLIEAASRLPDDFPWKLDCVGPISIEEGGGGEAYENELRLRVRERALEGRVFFRPPVFDCTKLAEIYRSFDCFCYPSVEGSGETFGVSVLEAMACGVPVIVSPLECFRTLVRDGLSGLVFSRGQQGSASLAERITGLARDGDLRRRLRRGGLARAAELSVEALAIRHLEDYEALAGSGGKQRAVASFGSWKKRGLTREE